MPAKSYSFDNEILNYWLRNQAQTIVPVATVYAALYTVAPTQSGGGTEVSGGSYARTAVTFGAPSNGVSTNSAPVTFPAATAGWGIVVAVAIFDNTVGGNMLYYGTLGTSKQVDNGDTASFAATSLSITEQ